MKRILLAGAMMTLLLSSPMSGQTIKLPAPNMKRPSLSVMETFRQRKSERTFSTRNINRQLLSDLLWAAQGKNRDDGKLTTPTCMNWQEIRLYVFDAQGVSLYDPQTHTLSQVVRGDHRNLVAGGQDWAKEAPISFVLVNDMDKMGLHDERTREMTSVDIGICTQNICLACAAFGLNTVPRGTMDNAQIQKLLRLSQYQIPVMNNPIGYPK